MSARATRGAHRATATSSASATATPRRCWTRSRCGDRGSSTGRRERRRALDVRARVRLRRPRPPRTRPARRGRGRARRPVLDLPRRLRGAHYRLCRRVLHVPPLPRRPGVGAPRALARPRSIPAANQRDPGYSLLVAATQWSYQRDDQACSGIAASAPAGRVHATAKRRSTIACAMPTRTRSRICLSGSSAGYQLVDLDGEGLSGVLDASRRVPGTTSQPRRRPAGPRFGPLQPRRRPAVPRRAQQRPPATDGRPGRRRARSRRPPPAPRRLPRARRTTGLGSRSSHSRACRTSTGTTTTCASST